MEAMSLLAAVIGVGLSVPAIALSAVLSGGVNGEKWFWRLVLVIALTTYSLGVWRMGIVVSGKG